MSTVREVTFELFREHRMTTIFGNPGSTELPMLAEFPEDFRYVLGLQEAVAVGMADGYSQASGRPALVNLHTAPGVGNGMGAIFNAQANKTPLVVTAGQQARRIESAAHPVMVAGPDIDASGAWRAAVAVAERQRLPVWATPAPGGGRIGFPEGHALFRGVLPPAIGPLAETLAGHDLIL